MPDDRNHRRHKGYGSTTVVDYITAPLPKGGITSIIGPNGAGKSTLLSMIARLIPSDQGTVLVDGMDVARTSGETLARRLSMLRQDTDYMLFDEPLNKSRHPPCRRNDEASGETRRRTSARPWSWSSTTSTSLPATPTILSSCATASCFSREARGTSSARTRWSRPMGARSTFRNSAETVSRSTTGGSVGTDGLPHS